MGLSQEFKRFIIVKVSKVLIHFIAFSCKKETLGSENVKRLKNSGKPIIYIFWHRHIFFNIFKFRNTNARPLISFSHDGELVSQIAKEFGMNPIRGSSSKGGARAFFHMVNAIKENNSEIMITADGPKGPPREIKDGTIHIAKKTGAYIIPISWYATRIKVFDKSWDKFMLPLPFGKIGFAYGEPIYIHGKVLKHEYSDYKKTLKSKLDDLEKKVMSELEVKIKGR